MSKVKSQDCVGNLVSSKLNKIVVCHFLEKSRAFIDITVAKQLVSICPSVIS